MSDSIKKATLGQRAADILRERIVTGVYEQGAKLSEEELAEEFAISRACVRDALRLLEAEGLLIREINKHTSVRRFSKAEAESLFSMRALLEIQAAKCCLEHDTVPFKTLETILTDMERIAKKGDQEWKHYFKVDLTFHEALVRASADPYIVNFWIELKSQYLMIFFSQHSDQNPPTLEDSISRHHDIIRLLQQKDLPGLEMEISWHIMKPVHLK